MDMASPKEIYLIDVLSDATDFGGLSETQLLHNESEGFLRVSAKFIRDRQGLQLMNNVMYCGFQNLYLVKQEFDGFNGLRVTMKPPQYPCKFGLHIKVSIGNEYEQFVGHILDTSSLNKSEW
jgi:hypothetical protein